MRQTSTNGKNAALPDQGLNIPKNFREIMRLTLRLAQDHLYRYWRKLLLSLVLISALAGLNILIANTMGLVTADLFNDNSQTSPYSLGILIITTFFLRGFFRFATFIAADSLSRHIELDMRHRLFKAIISLDMKTFDQSNDGYLFNRYINSSKSGAILLTQITQHRLREFLITCALIGYMFYLDWLGTLAVILLLPPSIWAVAYLAKKVRIIARDSLSLVDAQLTHMREVIHGIRPIRANAAEAKVEHEAELNRLSINTLARRNQFMSNILKPVNETSAGLAIAAIIVYGSLQVSWGNSTGAEVMKFIFALIMASEPMMRLARESVSFSSLSVDVAAFYQIIETPRTKDAGKALPKTALENPTITFNAINFHYDNGDKPTLKDVNFTAYPGQLTAIVGASGSGKSTLFNLILRFYEPQEGTISIDNEPIRDYSQTSLRNAIAYLPQTPFIFADTIRNNILIGRPEASDNEVIDAAKKAQAYDFIMALPNGFDTLMHSSGSTISGGQMQRISIARAFLRQASIVLLDEPTTGLDNETALSIKQSINALVKASSVLVIAHHFDTIKAADNIILLDNGEIQNTGKPQNLIKNSEQFCNLFQITPPSSPLQN